VYYDAPRCILCFRCVRVCDEGMGVKALGVGQRGVNSVIIPNREDHLECEECGMCIDICPVGALTSGTYRYKTRPWEMTYVSTVCAHCSNGCKTTLSVRNNEILRANNRDLSGINKEFLCIKGRYGFDFVHHKDRLKLPLVRRSGTLQPSSWEDALAEVAARLKAVRDTHGPDAIGFIGSNRTTNEENYLLGRLARATVGTNNVDHHRTADYGALVQALGETAGAAQAIDRDLHPQSFPVPGRTVQLEVRLIHEHGRGWNVIGLLPGTDPTLREQAVVVGAHYDHLGLGGETSLAPSRYGEIHPGADDNASGVAGVLGLARVYAGGGGARRTLVFVAFAGEEMGLLGSAQYARAPAFPLERTAAMLNMDMIGRLRGETLYVFGVETGKEFREVLEAANREVGLQVRFSGDGYGPSDHTPFSAKDRPVLFFFTGPHEDYHRPSDTPEKINAPGLARVVRLVAGVLRQLADGDGRVTFVRAGPSPRPGGAVAVPAGPGPGHDAGPADGRAQRRHR